MEVAGYLVITGPDNINDSVKHAAITCSIAAGVAAAGTGIATAGAGAAAAIAAAKVAFTACMGAQGAQIIDQFNITVDTPSHWTDWS
jgi:hypothetical protein